MEGRRKLLEITPKGQLGAFSSRILPHPPSHPFLLLFLFLHSPSIFLPSSCHLPSSSTCRPKNVKWTDGPRGGGRKKWTLKEDGGGGDEWEEVAKEEEAIRLEDIMNESKGRRMRKSHPRGTSCPFTPSPPPPPAFIPPPA